MGEAVRQAFVEGNEERKDRWESWTYYLSYAARRENSNRRAFYIIGIISLASAITVPALVGLNLSGTGGVVVRWITFAFSLLTALATGMLTLYRIGDRWLMYRRLMESLLATGRTLLDHAESADPGGQEAWRNFASATDKAISDYDSSYEDAVILVARHSARGHSGAADE